MLTTSLIVYPFGIEFILHKIIVPSNFVQQQCIKAAILSFFNNFKCRDSQSLNSTIFWAFDVYFFIIYSSLLSIRQADVPRH